MEYRNIKSRNFLMSKAVRKLNGPDRANYRQVPFDYTAEGQTTIIVSDHFDNCQPRFNSDPVLRKVRNAEPYQVAEYMHYVEQHFRLLVNQHESDAYPLFDAITELYGSKTNLSVMVTVGEQFKTAAKQVQGSSWAHNVELLVNYLDRVASLPGLPNLESAWRFIHKGPWSQHLVAALACVLDLNTVAIQQEDAGSGMIHGPRTKYIQYVEVSWANPWVTCVSFGDKGVERKKWAEVRSSLDWKMIHNWKSLLQLREDDEVDQTLEVLSGIGVVSDSS